jgi:hypothetical protein
VRLASAAADRKASQHLAEAEFNDAFHSNKYKRNTMNKPETPISPTPYTCPSTTTTTSSEDELESLVNNLYIQFLLSFFFNSLIL